MELLEAQWRTDRTDLLLCHLLEEDAVRKSHVYAHLLLNMVVTDTAGQGVCLSCCSADPNNPAHSHLWAPLDTSPLSSPKPDHLFSGGAGVPMRACSGIRPWSHADSLLSWKQGLQPSCCLPGPEVGEERRGEQSRAEQRVLPDHLSDPRVLEPRDNS